MTKLAPVMSALFPTIKEAVREAYEKSKDNPKIWQKEAIQALLQLNIRQMNERVCMDVIQGNITYYLLIEKNNQNALKEWWVWNQRGGLR